MEVIKSKSWIWIVILVLVACVVLSGRQKEKRLVEKLESDSRRIQEEIDSDWKHKYKLNVGHDNVRYDLVRAYEKWGVKGAYSNAHKYRYGNAYINVMDSMPPEIVKEFQEIRKIYYQLKKTGEELDRQRKLEWVEDYE